MLPPLPLGLGCWASAAESGWGGRPSMVPTCCLPRFAFSFPSKSPQIKEARTGSASESQPQLHSSSSRGHLRSRGGAVCIPSGVRCPGR